MLHGSSCTINFPSIIIENRSYVFTTLISNGNYLLVFCCFLHFFARPECGESVEIRWVHSSQRNWNVSHCTKIKKKSNILRKTYISRMFEREKLKFYHFFLLFIAHAIRALNSRHFVVDDMCYLMTLRTETQKQIAFPRNGKNKFPRTSFAFNV